MLQKSTGLVLLNKVTKLPVPDKQQYIPRWPNDVRVHGINKCEIDPVRTNNSISREGKSLHASVIIGVVKYIWYRPHYRWQHVLCPLFHHKSPDDVTHYCHHAVKERHTYYVKILLRFISQVRIWNLDNSTGVRALWRVVLMVFGAMH